MNDILDFTDYAKHIDFKYQNAVYRVPPFNKSQIETLMAINKKFVDIGGGMPDSDESDDSADDLKEISGKLETSNQYFSMQDEFLACALFKKEGESFQPVDISEFTNWPVKLKNRVMKIINEQMSTTIEDGDETEKKS